MTHIRTDDHHLVMTALSEGKSEGKEEKLTTADREKTEKGGGTRS